jgi:hypothetical protein
MRERAFARRSLEREQVLRATAGPSFLARLIGRFSSRP